LISIGAMVFHKRDYVPALPQQTAIPHASHGGTTKSPTSTSSAELQSGTPAPTLQGLDHAMLRLVPGGEVASTAGAGLEAATPAKVDSFYMDETLVTNHQYIEFLNQVLSRIKVDSGLVYGDGQLWLIIGEIMQGYEPIVFESGKFHIHGTQHAACPVLRVTAYGASAYAKFFGRRLPTAEEWLYVVTKGGGAQAKSTGNMPTPSPGGMPTNADNESAHTAHRNPSASSTAPIPPSFPAPVMLSKPDAYGIRGLNESVGEWAARKVESAEFVVVGRLWGDPEKRNDLPSAVRRYPWEAFEEVGFRTVLSVSSQDK
jgi:serine/threonine-protein kinase